MYPYSISKLHVLNLALPFGESETSQRCGGKSFFRRAPSVSFCGPQLPLADAGTEEKFADERIRENQLHPLTNVGFAAGAQRLFGRPKEISV